MQLPSIAVHQGHILQQALEDALVAPQVYSSRLPLPLDVLAAQQDITVPLEPVLFTAAQQDHIQPEEQAVAPVVQLVSTKDLVDKDLA